MEICIFATAKQYIEAKTLIDELIILNKCKRTPSDYGAPTVDGDCECDIGFLL